MTNINETAFVSIHSYYEGVIDKLEAERDRYREALQAILDYGKALQPNPVHPVTFNACVIAQEALSKAGETK